MGSNATEFAALTISNIMLRALQVYSVYTVEQESQNKLVEPLREASLLTFQMFERPLT